MEESDKPKICEPIADVYSKKKPLGLYDENEKHSKSLYSEFLKPKDVIASVSKQLRDIQKADSLKKEYARDIVKGKQFDFVPINLLSSQEGFHHLQVSNFETQCVTDTQLIDIVDNVEAMVNVNMTQDFLTTFCPVQNHLNKKSSEEINNVGLGGEFNNVVTETNNNSDCKGVPQFCIKKERLCIPEINTDVYNEFDTSYSEDHSDNNLVKNSKILKLYCSTDYGKSDTAKNLENFEPPRCKEISVTGGINKNYATANTVKLDNEKDTEFRYYIKKENGSNTVNILSIDTDVHSKFDDSIPLENNVPKSPIFNSSKPKTPSPLIFPLDSFQKFESIAMSLIEKNMDLETVKDLINSQIIDNQLLITAKAVSNQHNILNNELLENIVNKFGHTETSTESEHIANESPSFKDEILFSSDEENEYVHCCSKYLPKARANKPLFYERKIDLDATIFVGFQTSSNKCIQVSKESFFKAQSMFKSIDQQQNGNLTVTELVDIYDSKISAFNNKLPSEQVSDKDSNTNNNLNIHINNELNTQDPLKVLEETELMGLIISNDKSTNISEKPTLKCKTISKDLDMNLNTRADDIPLSSNLPLDIKMLGHEIKSSERAKIQQQDIKGHTEIKPLIKYEYMNIVDQTLLQEFENESIEEFIQKSNQKNCSQLQKPVDYKNTGTDIKKSQTALIINEKPLRDKDRISISELNENFDPGISEYPNIPQLYNNHMFFGFKTANNKEIKISTEALAKTKNLFHDIEFEGTSTYKRHSNDLFNCENKDFSTDKNVCDFGTGTIETDSRPKFCQPIFGFEGFKTASNKMVKISKEALLKSEAIFRDVNTTSICTKDMLRKNIGDAKNDVMLLNNNTKTPDTSSLHVFKTANDNYVTVSDEAIKKTKKVFQDINDIDVKNVGNTQGINSEKHIGNLRTPVYLNSKSNSGISSDINPVNIMNFDTCHDFDGFKTANNRPIIVSEASLLKTRKIFESIDNNDNNNHFKVAENEIVNLKTTSGRSNKHEPIDKIETSKTLNFQGFKTANGEQVAVSDDALAKTKYVFKDIDHETSIGPNKYEKERIYNCKPDMENVSNNVSEAIRGQRNESYIGVFKGFKTASHKNVMISDEAFAKTRKLFEDIHLSDQDNKETLKNEICFINEDIYKENKHEKENVSLNFGFKTANNKSSIVSKKTLINSRRVFSDIDYNYKIKNNISEVVPKEVTIDTKNNLNNIINTQLLNNFEQSLHTEDFSTVSTPKQCKRSGSPILSCPKAKKRKKFETPYRSCASTAVIQNENYRTNKKSDVKYTFSEIYKKCKLYSLKELARSDKPDAGATIDPYILNFEFDNLLNFKFDGIRNELTNVEWTVDNIKTCFVESVDNRIIPEGWLNNHLKLIIWKLISYEITFPKVMQNICSVRNILEQLKYRYDKELYRVERPILRKLLEKDDISTKTMILAVVGMYVNGVKVQSVTNPLTTVELLLTDGWYCIKACTDRMISRLVSEDKIAVGRKIATVGAELLGCEQGVSPWEDTSSVRLKLFGNSTRPARWDARLGCYSNGAILTRLSTIDALGGKVCKTRAVVVRVYPMLYVEKLEDGSTVTRSERLENVHQMKYETERQNQLEKLYEEVEKEFFDQDSSESEGVDTEFKKTDLSGCQLSRLMKKSKDLSQFRSHLTDSQTLLLQEYSSKKKEKIVEELQNRFQEKIRVQGLHAGRNVIPLLKIRVADIEETDSVKVTKAMISIWRPNDAILDVIKEDAWIDLYNVVPTAVRNGEIQISAGRQSVFRRSKGKESIKMNAYIQSLQRKCFNMKELNKNPAIRTDFNEIDTVGVVFAIEPSINEYETTKGQQFQNVYLTDVDKNFICINFWGGIKKLGYENIFEVGNIVACMNLQKRAGNTRKSIPQYRATEMTVFTKTPKLAHSRNIIEEFIKEMSGLDKRKFYQDCVSIKNDYINMKYTSEFSPYRFNTSDYNLTKNKIFIDSPLVQNKDVNFNLTGLDFESTFQEPADQDLSPAAIKRKQLVKEKIKKLKMYGEPPPLSKIHIINKTKNAGSAYKSPLTSNVLNVARMINRNDSPVTTNKVVQSSPVLSSNRTFVRCGVNPVKLNFSATSVGDDKTECSNPFEEEFETSPPLSLD